jgi:chemosensory pili system protein ChpA (sensor histidine kinase/response regulator)
MSRKSKKPTDKLTFANFILDLEHIADQAWQSGHAGLQDVSLLLADSLREVSESDPANTSILSVAAGWSGLVDTYKLKPKSATKDIIKFLRKPELNLPLAEDEFEMIEEQLSGEGGMDASENLIGTDAQHETQSFDYTAQFAQLADQAANENYFGLQDACLLLSDSFSALSPEQSAGIVANLSGWPTLVDAYTHEPQKITAELLNVLKIPALNIPLAADEFEMLEATLLEIVPEGDLHFEESATGPSASAEIESPTPAVTTDQSKINTGMLSPAAQEILIMMVSQADLISIEIHEIKTAESAEAEEHLQKAGELLQYFGLAGETAGFGGLGKVCNHVVTNISYYCEQTGNLTEDRLGLLRDWITQVKDYLLDITDSSSGQQLVFLLCDSHWEMPLGMEDAAEILMKIRSEGSDVHAYEEAARKTNAEADDVSLVLPGDVNQELLDLLLQELPIQTQQFSEAVQRMHGGGTTEDVQLAQRIAHTLKGSANTVGIKGIAVLTHNLEDILTACSREERMPIKALAASLINASDCLEGMSEALLGIGEPPADAQNVLQEILDWANRIDKEGVPQSEEQVTSVQSVAAMGADENAAAQVQTQTTMVRVPSDQIENLFRLSGENIILNGQAQESIRRMRNQIKLMQAQFALLQDLGNELERLIDLRDLSGRVFGTSDSGFDALEMDQYNELHTASRRMAESAVDAREISQDISKELDGMNEVLGFQQGLVIDAQEIVMQTRLVPIATIVPRLQRSLRQTCRLTGKECDLKLSGENILIDGDTLNAMVDPLMHVLRNAVDHGIESEDERTAMGKPNRGLIRFEFDREGNNILLRCRDDGRGLDYGAIRAAAEKRGVLKPGEEVTEDDLKKFILRPNFSTRTVTTQTSGRGVGMDVVRAQIVNLGGTLHLDSVQGQGLNVEILVPLPLSLTYALITNVARYRVAIANKGITQIIYSAEGDLIEMDGTEVLRMADTEYPTERLDKLLGTADADVLPVERLNDILHVTDIRKNSRTYGAVLLVQNEDKITAVLIGPITDSLDVVIKGMGYYVGKIPGFIGATILGDGAVTPVLDIPELLRMPARARENFFAEPQEAMQPVSQLPIALVVDDSLSQRRALEQLLTDAGFRVRTARDGIEAAEILASFKPDIILTDLEMPRMNGIELASHIRTQERIRHIPTIMITSRTTQKHKQMAEDAGIDYYLTKPVRDEDLLVKMNELMEQAASKERITA